MDKKETKLKRHPIFNNAFLDIYEDDVLLPTDKLGKRIVVDHIGAAAVLPLTKDNHVILVKQYRYAISEYSLEIPAGKKDDKEELGLTCVKRELEEETGYQSDTFKKLPTIYSAIGFSNEAIELFIATDCYQVKDPIKGDDDEFIEIIKIPLDVALKKITSGEIKDAKTIITLLLANENLK